MKNNNTYPIYLYPIYLGSFFTFVLVISPERMIKVVNSIFEKSIRDSTTETVTPFFDDLLLVLPRITKQEFDKNFSEVHSYLSNRCVEDILNQKDSQS